MAAEKALYVNGTDNTEVVPSGVANKALARNDANNAWVFAGAVLQSVFLPLTTDLTTATPTLLSQAITIGTGTKLVIRFNCNGSCTGANQSINFQVLIDGVAVGASFGGGKCSLRCTSTNLPTSVAYECVLTGLSAGSHTVRVDWAPTGTTGQCRPTQAGVYESAGLVLLELSA